MEYREFRADSVQVGDDGVIEGLVTPFGRETTIGDLKRGGFREEVGKGCFTKTLREGDALMIWQHNMAQPLARKSAGNLDLHEGTYEGHPGLVVRAEPVDTTYAGDMRKLAKAGVLGGFSFGFNVVKDEWFDDAGNRSTSLDGTRRVLREVELIEVSPVTRPAYKDTILVARDDSHALLEAREERAGSPKPYGDVKYADPKNGKYPVDTEEHARAAWSYINMPKNAAKYPMNGVSLESVKSKIKAALKHFGIQVSEEKSDDADTELLDPYEDSFYERDAEGRDDPDGEEYAAIDEAVRALKKDPPDIEGALKPLQANQAARSQEPEASTPEPEPDAALSILARASQAKQRSRELGFD